MKKWIALLLLCVLLLCGCQETQPELYIEPAQLTPEEKNIANLLGANSDQRIFDFHVDDTVQRMEINAYELVDGEWDMFFGGGGSRLTETKGRVAVDFDWIGDGVRIAYQTETQGGSSGWADDPGEDHSNMNMATSLLSERTPVVYEQEIALAIQVCTESSQITSYNTTYFDQPQMYEDLDYEHVYAITVKFSQIPLS